MNAKCFSSVASLLVLFASATFVSAQNVLLFTFDDSGPNVTATVTGSFDISGLNSVGQSVPRVPDVFFGSRSFGTTTATRIERFEGVFLSAGPNIFLPLLSSFPSSTEEGSIVTPLSEYFEITVGIVEGDSSPTIGLALGETIFNADALENNVIVFRQSSLDDLGDVSFLSETPTVVLYDATSENTIQFVLGSPEFLLGDVNQDGVVNFQDISPFIAALVSGDNFGPADIDLNGEVNFLDIAPFIAILAEIL